MAYVARPTDFQASAAFDRVPAGAFAASTQTGSPSANAAKQTTEARGFLRRLYDAIMDSRQQRANRDAEAFLARRGYRITDSIERELNEHMFNGGWQSRR